MQVIPRGFASGDAGKGALVDGVALDVETDANPASMLFVQQLLLLLE